MRAMTYNILKGGLGADAATPRTPLLLRVLQSAAPDLLVLNECNGFERDQQSGLRAYGQALAMSGHLARASSGYHVALFTRNAEVSELAVHAEGFAHVALSARVRLGDYRLLLLAAHLDPFSPQQRLQEARGLLALRARLERPDEEILLLGDLNALSPRDTPGLALMTWSARYRARHGIEAGRVDTAAVQALERAGLVDLVAEQGGSRPTRPTAMYWKKDVPAQRVDYLFGSPGLVDRLTGAQVIDTETTQAASDHLPVLVDFSD